MTDSDSILDQILWQAAKRLSPVAETVNGDHDPISALLDSGVRPQDARAWYSGLEWVFAALEVLSSAGCALDDTDNKIDYMQRALREFPPRASHVSPSWRLGLARDYLARIHGFNTTPIDRDGVYIYYFGELDALVEEFMTSESGGIFLQWARAAERPDNGWQVRRSASLITRLENDRASPLIAFGATEYLRLVENYSARLEELTGVPDLMSACWAFHADLFEDRRPLLAAISLHRTDQLLTDLPSNSRSTEEHEFYTELIPIRPRQSSRPSLEPVATRLSQSRSWSFKRRKAQWKDVLEILD